MSVTERDGKLPIPTRVRVMRQARIRRRSGRAMAAQKVWQSACRAPSPHSISEGTSYCQWRKEDRKTRSCSLTQTMRRFPQMHCAFPSSPARFRAMSASTPGAAAIDDSGLIGELCLERADLGLFWSYLTADKFLPGRRNAFPKFAARLDGIATAVKGFRQERLGPSSCLCSIGRGHWKSPVVAL